MPLSTAEKFYVEHHLDQEDAALAEALGVTTGLVSKHRKRVGNKPPTPTSSPAQSDTFERHKSGAVTMTSSQSQAADELKGIYLDEERKKEARKQASPPKKGLPPHIHQLRPGEPMI